MSEAVDRISVQAMRELVTSGEAKPLFIEFDIGPTSYDGRWWHIPSEAPKDADYVVASPERAAEFDRSRERLDRIDTFLSQQ